MSSSDYDPSWPFVYETAPTGDRKAIAIRVDEEGVFQAAITHMGGAGSGTQMGISIPASEIPALIEGLQKAAGLDAEVTV